MTVKQVIVVRTDLGMRKGKMIAQGAHASMIWLVNELKYRHERSGYYDSLKFNNEEQEWLFNGKFTKICVGVGSEQELIDIFNKAKDNNLTVHEVIDCGDTEFHGVPTRTCIAIGPHSSELIDQITGHLKLL